MFLSIREVSQLALALPLRCLHCGDGLQSLLRETADRAARYLAGLPDRTVAPTAEQVDGLKALAGPLPQGPSDAAEVLALLDQFGSPATVATAGGRYFGFVIGGSLPAALAANWLAGAWDQNAALQVMSPVAAKLEEIVLEWMVDLLGLPAGCAAGFVTGTTMANFTALAAARTALLHRAGWNVEEDGLFSAPAHPRRGWRRGACFDVEGVIHAGAGTFPRDPRAGRQPGTDAVRSVASTR